MINGYHNSRDEFYRFPVGALPTGKQLTLRFLLQGKPYSVTLRTWVGESKEYEMVLLGANGEGYLYECTFPVPSVPCLLWYRFHVNIDNQQHQYGNAPDTLGGVGMFYNGEASSYQVTVYDECYAPPKWLREGAMYQIFPDRFYKSGTASHTKPYAVLHQNWYEEPTLKIDPNSSDNVANDFFGGNLQGIIEKLPYLVDLGITVLYLNPIFESTTNHRYNTSDYMRVDSMLGSEADFTELTMKAKEYGIRILLDGVFSHTGDDSIYFNKHNTYDIIGAYQSLNSPYAPWYTFKNFPKDYVSWWGFPTLPEVNELAPSYMDFIIGGHDSVTAKWLNLGACGWRLDVADELPMDFLRALHKKIKDLNPDGVLLGEVWEDASSKYAYGELRTYCLGDTLDSVMNYPLRDAAIAFMIGDLTAFEFARRIESLKENYPAPFFYSLMNLIGSHDKSRILNVLAKMDGHDAVRAYRQNIVLTDSALFIAKRRLVALWKLICALPGMPSIYYGDEAGMEGTEDPFCRGTFPWGNEDAALTLSFRESLKWRNEHRELKTGHIRVFPLSDDVLLVVRYGDAFGNDAQNGTTLVLINRSDEVEKVCFSTIDVGVAILVDANNNQMSSVNDVFSIDVLGVSAKILWSLERQ